MVVDEAHAFRNAGNTWYRAMTRLLGGARKDVALLTATPINNTLWDLFNLVMLFARHDRALAAAGIDSIRAEFLAAGANERDAERLNPDRLFRLADAVERPPRPGSSSWSTSLRRGSRTVLRCASRSRSCGLAGTTWMPRALGLSTRSPTRSAP